MMKYLLVYYGDTPLFVEGFSGKCERSCTGSLHLLPRRPVTVTEDELTHLKVHYPHLIKFIKIISQTDDQPISDPLVAVNEEKSQDLPQTVDENRDAISQGLEEEQKAKGWLKRKSKEGLNPM